MIRLIPARKQIRSSHKDFTSDSINPEDASFVARHNPIRDSSESSWVWITCHYHNNRCRRRQWLTQRHVIFAWIKDWSIIVNISQLYFDHSRGAQATCKQTQWSKTRILLVLKQISIDNNINHCSYLDRLRWLETRKNSSSHNPNRPICRPLPSLIEFRNRLASSCPPRGYSLRLHLRRSRDRLRRPIHIGEKKENVMKNIFKWIFHGTFRAFIYFSIKNRFWCSFAVHNILRARPIDISRNATRTWAVNGKRDFKRFLFASE